MGRKKGKKGGKGRKLFGSSDHSLLESVPSVEQLDEDLSDSNMMEDDPSSSKFNRSDTLDIIDLTDQQLTEGQKTDRRNRKKQKQREKKLARVSADKRRDEFALQYQDESELCEVEEAKITLYKSPVKTIKYFLHEIPCVLIDAEKRFTSSIITSLVGDTFTNDPLLIQIVEFLTMTIAFTICVFSWYFWHTCTDPTSMMIKRNICWHLYWIFLGILSSVGLGTGLHTFILYLGPFIAKVTLAAQECSNLDFPQPPYPDQIICSKIDENSLDGQRETIPILMIMRKVWLESLSWGFGTALGELPPYFMARAAKLSSIHRGNNDVDNSEESNMTITLQQDRDKRNEGFIQKGKLLMKHFVEKVGFFGILICASIPNPLFDLAGITCGHFLIPFMTFFGATVIGKTLFKSQIQMLFVIVSFNQHSLNAVLEFLGSIPMMGKHSKSVFVKFMNHQKASLRNEGTDDSGGVMQFVLEKFVMCMIIYFVISIINGMAQSYYRRLKTREKNVDHVELD